MLTDQTVGFLQPTGNAQENQGTAMTTLCLTPANPVAVDLTVCKLSVAKQIYDLNLDHSLNAQN